MLQVLHTPLQHFVFLERPSGSLEVDGSGFVVPSDYVRSLGVHNRLMPSAQDYETVGHLYHAIAEGLKTLAGRHGEAGLFTGDPSAQVGPDVVGLPGLACVIDLRSALAAVETIVTQGEGASLDVETGHYQRFVRIRTEYQAVLAADASFVPSRPVARNPVMRRPPEPRDKVFIEAPAAAATLDLANALYGQMVRLLHQGFGRPGGGDAQRPFLDAAIDLMFALVPVAEHLTTLPARGDDSSCSAGITFSTLRPLAMLPYGAGERRVLEQRFDELTRCAEGLRSGSDRMNRAADAVARTASAFAAHIFEASDVRDVAPETREGEHQEPESPEAAEGAGPDEPTAPDEAEGSDLTLRFDTRRCIHARFCVTGAPETFLANVEGPWLHPDRTSLHLLIEVAHACPSGAITYRRKDGGADESAPKVNLLSVRENGPYAVRAPISIDGEPDGYRATLCRCGASSRKPYCDGSHARIGFIASGEPVRQSDAMLPVRDGPLDVRAQTDGPLRVSGPIEIISGTGRVVSRVTSTALCRCGGSTTKPFCDGTHKRIGFRA